MLRPLLDLGQATVADGPPAVIVASWHPLRPAAMWRKAMLAAEIVAKLVDGAEGLEGDTKLYFKDLAEDPAHPFYPEVVASWAARRPELLAFVDGQGDYSLHERPVVSGDASGEVNDDPGAGARAFSTPCVQRYMRLHSHEQPRKCQPLAAAVTARPLGLLLASTALRRLTSRLPNPAKMPAESGWERNMQLNGAQKKLLEWIDAKQPVIGLFHVMTEIKPMIDGGFIEARPIPRSKGQLVVTDRGKAAIATTH